MTGRDAVVRVVLVDDQELVRSGLRLILRKRDGFEVVAECSDGDELPTALASVTADVVVMDLRMKRVDGIEATRRLRAEAPEPPVLVLTTFDDDELLDYRARRPAMLFVEDHWESYADPELAVHLLHDANGVPFLLLAGPEPDVQWERFTEAVRMVVERLGVRLTIGLNAIPMGVPHTRPTGVIAHGSRKELVAAYEPWVNAVQVPGTAGHLLEYRLGQAGRDARGRRSALRADSPGLCAAGGAPST